MKIFLLLLLICTIGMSLKGHADILPMQKYMTDATKIGESRLEVLIWDVYDATLYSESNIYDEYAPIALTLDYLMKIKGVDIAKRSIKEIRKQGFDDEQKLNEWEQKLKTIFPDVDKGISITGIRNKDNDTIFYKHDQKIGQIKDAEFTKLFFDIWLGQGTSQPYLRKKLLGLN